MSEHWMDRYAAQPRLLALGWLLTIVGWTVPWVWANAMAFVIFTVIVCRAHLFNK